MSVNNEKEGIPTWTKVGMGAGGAAVVVGLTMLGVKKLREHIANKKAASTAEILAEKVCNLMGKVIRDIDEICDVINQYIGECNKRNNGEAQFLLGKANYKIAVLLVLRNISF